MPLNFYDLALHEVASKIRTNTNKFIHLTLTYVCSYTIHNISRVKICADFDIAVSSVADPGWGIWAKYYT